MKIVLGATLLSLAVVAQAQVMATWTGEARPVVTVTGQAAFVCVYQYAGQKFTVTMPGHCPPTIPGR